MVSVSITDMQTRISLARSEAEGLAGYLAGPAGCYYLPKKAPVNCISTRATQATVVPAKAGIQNAR